MQETIPEINKYDYDFPTSLIATKPASPRDSARLLVYDSQTSKVCLNTFKNLSDYLPNNSVLVLNQTKVLPARLVLKKQSGGVVSLLFSRTKGNIVIALSNKSLSAGTKLFAKNKMLFTVISRTQGEYKLMPAFPVKSIHKILEKYGTVPLPPYIKNSSLSKGSLKKQYQTVFAKNTGSVAAPTASLHFTRNLLSRVKRKGVKIVFITLHVNLGTFASLTRQQIATKKLHSEWYEIPKAAAAILNRAKKLNRPVFAVGTTVVRTLESGCNGSGKLSRLNGYTNLFIQEGYEFKFVNGIITNFHVPKSSLLMLVSAFIGRKKLLELYKIAISKKFRLFSFGDGMLIK